MADLLASFCLATVDQVNQRFDEAYEPAFVANVRLFDDALPLLDAVGMAGIPIGLFTNSSAHHTRQKLGITGLAGAFEVVVTRDTLGFGKPDVRAFHHACRLMGSAPCDTVYVGDDVEIDAIAARDAGLSGIWLRRDPATGRAPPGLARAVYRWSRR